MTSFAASGNGETGHYRGLSKKMKGFPEWWNLQDQDLSTPKFKNCNRNDFPSQGPNRRQVPQKEHTQTETAISDDQWKFAHWNGKVFLIFRGLIHSQISWISSKCREWKMSPKFFCGCPRGMSLQKCLFPGFGGPDRSFWLAGCPQGSPAENLGTSPAFYRDQKASPYKTQKKSLKRGSRENDYF